MAVIIATVFKETKNAPPGLQLISVDDKVMIKSVVDGGLFSSTDLRAGMEVVNINGKSMKGKNASYALDKILSSRQGEVWIAAKEPTIALPVHESSLSTADDPIVTAVTVTDDHAEREETAAYDVDPSPRQIERLIPLSLPLPGEFLPPPGVAGGGIWGETTYCGPTTVFLACAGCALVAVGGIGCVPRRGIDKKRAYAVQDMVYDEDGRVCGKLGSVSFTPDENHLRYVKNMMYVRVSMSPPQAHDQMNRHDSSATTPEVV